MILGIERFVGCLGNFGLFQNVAGSNTYRSSPLPIDANDAAIRRDWVTSRSGVRHTS